MYPTELIESIEEIIGFKISQKTYQSFLEDFIASKGYYFKNISKFNLPYYFLYLLPNQKLFNCVVLNQQNIEDINSKSDYFKVDINKRLKRKSEEFLEFEFILVNHRKTHDKEIFDLQFFERKNSELKEIVKRTIKIDSTLFYNKICGREFLN